MLSPLYWRQIMPGDKAIYTHKVLKMESRKLQRGHWWVLGSFKSTLSLIWGKTSKLHLRYLRIILLSYLYYCLNVFSFSRFCPSTEICAFFSDISRLTFLGMGDMLIFPGQWYPGLSWVMFFSHQRLLVRYLQWNSESLSFTFFEYLLPLYWSTLLKIRLASLSEGKILKVRGSRLGYGRWLIHQMKIYSNTVICDKGNS